MKSLALRNVTVIDCTGKPAMLGMTVVIVGNRIESLNPVGKTTNAAGVQVVDASGKFLIPGLWDMHVHWWPGENGSGLSPLFIPNGVTGVRTMGGGRDQSQAFIKLRGEIAEGKSLGPRLIVASQTLNSLRPLLDQEAGPEDVRVAVKDGADLIKVYSGLSRKAYFDIVEEARKLGIPFGGHVPQPEVSLEEASNAGQTSIEHIYHLRGFIRQRMGSDEVGVSGLNDSDRAALFKLFETLRKNGTWSCPTHIAQQGNGPILRADPRLKYFPAAVKDAWARKGASGTPASPERMQRIRNAEHELTGAMHKAGVGILAGSDAAPGVAMPGFMLHDELQRLVTAGLSPMDALRTATYNPAEFLGLLDSLGTVAPGKLAELVLLDANPLDDIANTTKINAVFTGGRMYPKKALDAILSAVEANAARN
ncbi:MAG TPA: amidohydrolase family protein [Vicinamibacterales bacterium]|nr:amidohydrolase family protein [Vicinamibacterales bacterium]